MTIKYHQIVLSDIFSDCQNKLIDNSPSFFSFFQNTLTWMDLSHPNFVRLSIILWEENGIIP